MKVKGIGTDICAVKRVEELLKKQGERFVERVLTEAEIEAKGGKESLVEDAAFMTRRFAAKEAIAKALGTGIGKQLSFQDITIDRKGNRRPIVSFENGKMEGITVHLSVSDENDFALAFAVAMLDGEEGTATNDADTAETKPKRTRKPFGRRGTKKEAKIETTEESNKESDVKADAPKTEKPEAAAQVTEVKNTGIQVTVVTPTEDK